MKKLMCLLIVGLIGCDELVTTQNGDFNVSFENGQSEMMADGHSYVKIRMKFDRKLAKNEKVTVTTTNGHFVELPANDYSTGSSKVEVYPDSKDYAIVLVAGYLPDEDVIIGVMVAKSYKEKSVKFMRVCPTELAMDLDKSTISISSAEKVAGSVDLFNASTSVSHDTRIDLKVFPDSIASVTPRLYYNGETIQFDISPTGKTGEVSIYAQVNQGTCDELLEVVRLEITK